MAIGLLGVGSALLYVMSTYSLKYAIPFLLAFNSLTYDVVIIAKNLSQHTIGPNC